VMLNYLLLLLIALSMFACPSKPSRRPPVLNTGNAEGESEEKNAGATTFKSAGFYLALHNEAESGGYQPLVLHIDARGLAVPVATSKVYSSGALFNDTADLAQKDAQAINLVLAFTVEEKDSYCVNMALTEVLQLVSGDNETEIKQRLIATNAQPLDLSTSQGRLEQQAGKQQCVK